MFRLAIYLLLAVFALVTAILGLVFKLLGWIFNRAAGRSQSTKSYSPGTPDNSSMPPLMLRVQRDTHSVGGVEIPCYVVKIKGQVPGPIYAAAPVELFFHLFDCAKHEGMQPPVLSSLPGFQEEETAAFQCRMDPQELSGQNYFSEWVEMFKVPVDCLGFPRKGRRRLKMRLAAFLADNTVASTRFHFGCLSQGGDAPYGFVEASFPHEVSEPGYLDESKNRPKVRASTIELAFHLAAADGSIDDSEEAIIEAWAKKKTEMVSDDKSEAIKRELYDAIAKGREAANSGESSLDSICQLLADLATEHQKYDALQLCVDVMSADGTADESELETLDQVVGKLDLDAEQYRKMLDPHLAKVEMNTGAAEGGDRKALLGIQEGMEPDEIRKILTDANGKWNSRLRADDPAIRERAEEMKRLIAELREELLD